MPLGWTFIKRVLGEQTYLVDLPHGGRRGRHCHRDMLKRFFHHVLSTTLVLAADEEAGGNLLTTSDILESGKEEDEQTKWDKVQLDPELTAKQQEELMEILKEYTDVLKNTPGEAKVVPFTIPTGDACPIATYPRRLPPKWKEKIHQEIKLLESTGVVVPSTSRWSFPIRPVPKPNGDVCVDYRQLNDVTTTECYPLPDIGQLLDEAAQATYLTTLDLTKGYYQVPVAANDRQKTAFITPTGKWEFTRMPFGLKGAPAAFQMRMDEILSTEENSNAYIDDVSILAKIGSSTRMN